MSKKSLLFCGSEVLGKLSSISLNSSANTDANTGADGSANGNADPIKKPNFIITVDPSIIQEKALQVEYANKNSSSSGKLKVMLCGTYPIGQSNGYSRVVYYISKFLGIKDDIILTIYGFQNFNQTAGSDLRSDISSNVILHDALATENPRRNGFGEKEIGGYLKSHPQDIVIIFNDLTVTAMLVQTIMNELTPFERKQFKLVSYLDQVYPYQKKEFVVMLNTYFDAIIAFTPYWRTIARTIGIDKKIPCYVFPHGFDHTIYYPIPRNIARLCFNIPEDAFAILNLNRNQPRKRWDHTMIAIADVISRYHALLKDYEDKLQKSTKTSKALVKPKPVRLIVGTAADGSWNIFEILEHELKLRNVPFDFGKECITCVANPQTLSDRDINVLYNSCDIGLNTCEGEGFGLCQIEHMAVGCPQVVQKIGGMQEFLNNDNSILVDSKWRYYIDKHRDGIGGIAEVGDPNDFADAIWTYYTDKKKLDKHGKAGRINILQHYRWNTVVDYFHTILKDMKTRLFGLTCT